MRVGIVGAALDAAHDLGAHPLDGVSVETRLGQRQAQQFEGLAAMARQRLKAGGDRIPRLREAQHDCLFVGSLLKGDGIIGAGAFIEHARQEMAESRLAGRVLRRAALEGQFHGDERNRLLLDQPGLDAAGRDHPLDARTGGSLLLARCLERDHAASSFRR